MCGITGIYSRAVLSDLDKRIGRMNKAIIHRGPDSGAVYTDQAKVAIGHRRLSIIDLRAISNQPMHSSSGDWHIAFNGEIYNFKEIKEKLSYPFVTESDTEVILAAVEEKGVDWFLEQSNGMFVIALYNSKTAEIILVRDRLGIKPLFYFNDGDKLVYSSEIKAILESGLVEANFNELAIDEYLANRYIREPYTFFKNIYQIKAGTYICIKKDLSFIEKRFWTLPSSFNMSTIYDEDKIANELENELTKAIKYRLISDVPVGTYLSGGVDSSLISAIAAINNANALNTYTIGFEELNEFEYAAMVADKYNTDHNEILIKKEEYLDNWKRLIKYKDAPLGVPNEIPLAIMSSKLKERVTVVLSGEGADELLGGYGRIFRLPFDYNNSEKNTTFYETFIKEYEYVSREMRDDLISTPSSYRNEFDKKIIKTFGTKSNEAIVFNFFHSYHVKGLLQRVDMTTMQTSVEARVPFLDHNLIEFCYKEVPYELKLRWKDQKSKEKAKSLNASEYSEKLDTPKYILRKISYKYLPKEIIERKKVGFPVPLTNWFDNLEEISKELLTNASWLKEGAAERLIESSMLHQRAGQILWMFINIELFKREYFNKTWKW